MSPDLTITSIGARAAKALTTTGSWQIAVVFQRSAYLRAGKVFVCIGDASIGNGPLNVLVAGRIAITTGTSVSSGDQQLVFANGTRLSWTSASIWRPPPWPVPLHMPHHRNLAIIAQVAGHAAPSTSFLHAAARVGSLDDPMLHRAARGLQLLRSYLETRTDASADAAALALLGLGLGATPSGDDVLAGAVLALHAVGQRGAAVALTTAIQRHACARTSPLSAYLLGAACDGEASEPVHTALAQILRSAPPEAVISSISDLGHSSGFDLLAGLLIVLEIYAL